jgi:hypothetical protein
VHLLRKALLLAAPAASLACGPLQTTGFLLDAEASLRTAREARAPELAPYEWTLASLYFGKAKEEAGYADYEEAVEYAREALQQAGKAREQAEETARTLPAEAPRQPPPARPAAPPPASRPPLPAPVTPPPLPPGR